MHTDEAFYVSRFGLNSFDRQSVMLFCDPDHIERLLVKPAGIKCEDLDWRTNFDHGIDQDHVLCCHAAGKTNDLMLTTDQAEPIEQALMKLLNSGICQRAGL